MNKEINQAVLSCIFCGNEISQNENQTICYRCKYLNRDDNSINEDYLNIVREYEGMSLIKRQKIKPIWLSKRPKRHKGKWVIQEFEIAEVLRMIESTGTFNTKDVLENKPKSNRRIISILKAWENRIGILPPSIKFGDKLTFNDGRHRCLAARFLGEKTIPVRLL